MSFLSRIERGLDSAINGVFTRAFAADVHPSELLAAILREMDTQAMIVNRKRSYVPNHFTVHLSPHDYERQLPSSGKFINEDAPEAIERHKLENNYHFAGPLEIEFVEDRGLRTGKIRIESSTVAGVEVHDNRQQPQPTQGLILEVNGVRHPLRAPGLSLGRAPQCDIRINDTGVSREHALIEVTPGGMITIVDNNSTNGLYVNGERVSTATLRAGSRIEIGNTRMQVYQPGT
ncbi:MAG: hypothetical protein CSA63_01715 [Propionibacterium sp.]|nr:MAG: hypothetical protein CSA63_01715 [Propionibacterium sp.]